MPEIKNSLTNFMEVLEKIKPLYTHGFCNSTCCECLSCEPFMVKVGALVFCHKCFTSHFTTADPVIQERKKYLELVHQYIK